ncbi:MAG: hypothetical protein ACFFD1_11145, partial [Candidatus Thorarchaeota archaeon]
MERKDADPLYNFIRKIINVVRHPKLSSTDLRRHYKIEDSEFSNTSIYEFDKQLNLSSFLNIDLIYSKNDLIGIFILKNRLSDVQFLFPPIELDLLSPYNLQLFFNYFTVFKEDINPIIVIGSMTEFVDFTVIAQRIDSTNLHYILEFRNGEQIRFKKYTRFTRNQTHEAVIGNLLADHGFYPKIHSVIYLSFENILIDKKPPFNFLPLGIFMENLKESVTIESILGNIYLEAIKNPSSRTKSLINEFISIIGTVFKFLFDFEGILAITSENTLVKDIFDDKEIEYELWIDSFRKKFSNLPNFQNYPFEKIVIDKKEIQLIHGDCWLRQLIILNKEMYLIDLEDATFGHAL